MIRAGSSDPTRSSPGAHPKPAGARGKDWGGESCPALLQGAVHPPRGFIAQFVIQSCLVFNPAQGKKGSGSSARVLGAKLSHMLAQRDSREPGKAQRREVKARQTQQGWESRGMGRHWGSAGPQTHQLPAAATPNSVCFCTRLFFS